MSLPATILLDLDGTLVDSAPDLITAVNRMLAALDRPPAEANQVRQWVGNGARKLVERALAGAYHPEPPPTAEQLAQALPLFYRAYHDCNGNHSRLYPGVAEFLDAAHRQGVQLAVVTNKPAEFTQPMLRELGIAGYFGSVVSGDSVIGADGEVLRKPDPAHLQRALTQLHAGTDSAWMIGDSRSDILGAHNLGITAIAVSYGYNQGMTLQDHQPDRIVDCLTELL